MAKILIVDDSAFQRDNLRYLLQLDNHIVLEAKNGREGLEKIAAHAPDCVLLDIMMPELDGWDVLEALRKRGARVPVIMLIADIQESTRQKCLERGAVAVMHKPVKVEGLRNIIHQALSLNPRPSPAGGAKSGPSPKEMS